MTDAQFLAWGWRVPFLLGILLLGVGLFIRLRIQESPLFDAMKSARTESRAPVLEALREHPRSVLVAMGARFAENASFYIFTVFVLTYATGQLGVTRPAVLNAVLLASVVHFIAIPLFGALSDRVGRRPVYLGGALFTAVFAFPFFMLIETKAPGAIVLAITLALVGHAAMYGPQAAFFSELFGTRVRYSGVSLGYQLAAPFAGGLAPLIATALLKYSDGRPWLVATYVAATAVVTLVCVGLAKETHRSNLAGSGDGGDAA